MKFRLEDDFSFSICQLIEGESVTRFILDHFLNRRIVKSIEQNEYFSLDYRYERSRPSPVVR